MDLSSAKDAYIKVFLSRYINEKFIDNPIKFFGRLAGIGIFEFKTIPHPSASKYGENYTVISKAALEAYNSKALTFKQLSKDHVIGRQYSGEYLIKYKEFHPRAKCITLVLSAENFAHASNPEPEYAVKALGDEMYVVKNPPAGRRPKDFMLTPVETVKTIEVYSLSC